MGERTVAAWFSSVIACYGLLVAKRLTEQPHALEVLDEMATRELHPRFVVKQCLNKVD